MTDLVPSEGLAAAVAATHAACLEIDGGHVATYIPELGRADPARLAVAACTVAGEVAAVGDEAPFTLQSMCKPLLYAAALDTVGVRRVLAHVGVEPTGRRFDSIVRLDAGRHRPHNPMINAGAIAVAGLLVEHEVTLDVLASFTGRPVEIDEAVFESERSTAHNNRAIVHLLTHLGLVRDPAAALDLYLRGCSVSVTCTDLAVIGATLANRGVNPRTGVRAVAERNLASVLTVMATCGMYDGSGRFAMEVGLPAKSGVSGGILAVAPGRVGLAGFAPPLDEAGNSVRGHAAVGLMARRLGYDAFDAAPTVAPPPHLEMTLELVAERQRHGTGGQLAAYAPEVQAADPDAYAVATCALDGARLAIADADAPFTIQAAANPFAYALALERHGAEVVHARVDSEPSGNRFDAVDLRPESGRPYNPLSNCGAIAVADLLDASDTARLAEFAGVALPVDPQVLAAEWRAGHRNLGIAHKLRGAGVIDDVERAVERYLTHCSLVVSCATLARMAATIAGGGVDPVSGRRVVSREVARRVTAAMYTCGMHDDSGVCAFEVGMPSKSGITGGLIAVVPGVMGVAVYSPRVSRSGASVRGWATLRDLASTLGLGLFDPLAASRV